MAIDFPVQADSHGFKGDGGNLRESDLNQGLGATYLSDHRGGVKFNKRFAGRFGEFEALEFISLGILGKRALWRVLKEAEVKEVRALAIDLDRLIKSAQIQYEEVESWRLNLGKNVLQSPPNLDAPQ